MEEKVLFSVIKKDKDGAILRNTKSRLARKFTWEEINQFFIREGSDWLYSWNSDNPFEDEINDLSAQISKDLAEITPHFLLIRANKSLTDLSTFGLLVENFCKKYEISVFEFVEIFRSYFKTVFGVFPSFDGILTIENNKNSDDK